MAEAILSGLLAKKVAAAKDIAVSDVLPARRDYLKKQYGVAVADRNAAVLPKADVVVLAVKPQQLGEVLGGLKGKLAKDQAVLSIVAGATIAQIAAGLGHKAIVRSMPNTPGQYGVGMTAWTATPQVTEARKAQVKQVVAALGEEVYVADEKYIDVATAISGSGPAYVFLFIEAITDAGVYLGMARDMAHKLAVQTVLGSGVMAAKAGKSPSTLREQVTSPGGTTAEALRVLEGGGFRALMHEAVVAAYQKAVDLREGPHR
jgi:pyrroline-5-carboxylate reductase